MLLYSVYYTVTVYSMLLFDRMLLLLLFNTVLGSMLLATLGIQYVVNCWLPSSRWISTAVIGLALIIVPLVSLLTVQVLPATNGGTDQITY